MPRRRHKTMKGIINELIDSQLHPKGAPSDLGTIMLDELLHTAFEGKFRPDKFMKYTVIPNLLSGRGRRKRD